MWNTVLHYLGLGPDEEYDDYDTGGDPDAPPKARSAPPEPPPARSGAVRPLPRASQERSSENGRGQERPGPERPGQERQGRERAGAVSAARRPAVVRALGSTPSSSKPFAVAPASFNDAQQVADTFMATTPVIVNLEGVDRELARRLVDFASGLCYGLGGQMEKVTTSVYLLTPNDVEVSAEDRRKLERGGA